MAFCLKLKHICFLALFFTCLIDIKAQDTIPDFVMDRYMDDSGIKESKNTLYFDVCATVLGKWGFSYERAITSWFEIEPEISLLLPYSYNIKYIIRRDDQYKPGTGWSYSFSTKFNIINIPEAKIFMGLTYQQMFYNKDNLNDKFNDYTFSFGITKTWSGRFVVGYKMGLGIRNGDLQSEDDEYIDVVLPISYKIGMKF